ncbi:hypothetical protein ULG90_22035 [Halopseudomonas pachastrellae]|nr:hypothetical protein ULG90_22035 [Halopseudomonas pachastrellae]
MGCPHDIKGQCIYVYVTPMNGVEPSEELVKELKAFVADQGGALPAPSSCNGLRACRKPARARSCAASCARSPATSWIAWATPQTLADPTVVQDLISNRIAHA